MLLRHQILLRKKLSIPNKVSVTFALESIPWTVAPSSINRLLKTEVGNWQKRSCVMGGICQLLQTIMPEVVLTEGFVKCIIKLVCTHVHQKE